jgi:hypothetical protein
MSMTATLETFLFSALLLAGLALSAAGEAPPAAPTGLIFSANGEPADPSFFPLAVWLQSPRNAPRYKSVGINLYVGLYEGPTAEELSDLAKAGMPVICDQNAIGLGHKDNPIIAGWMHGDEPDNAQSLGKGQGYGPPILPQKILDEYRRMRAADPSRPVMLNLGQSVAWDNYIGRGVRRNHPEDYPEYVKGGDIVSFDIYPVVHDSPEVAGKLEFVARGVERLVAWTGGGKSVWNCVECTHIGNATTKPTPEQVRSEVWMGLIRGSRGIIYFAHQFSPSFKEAALLADPEMAAGIREINRQIRELAPVLNSPTIKDQLTVQSPHSSVAAMLKQSNGAAYVFAVNLAPEPARGAFTFRGTGMGEKAEALGESRSLSAANGTFSDDFPPYGVHLYQLAAAKR